MNSKALLFLFLAFHLLSLIPIWVLGAEAQLIVRVTLSDGTPIAGVFVRIVGPDNETIASEITDEYGQAVFRLPGNQTFTVYASYGVWNESKTVSTVESVNLVSFVVKYGLPIEEYTIPLRLTIWAPGGFILTFEDADNVTASVSSFNPRSKYNLIVKKNYVNFETNESGTYVINVYVSYRRLDWYSGSLITYSKTALVRTVQSFSFYSRKLVVMGLLDTIIGPHYPTPEEVAKAQVKYLTQVKNDILKEIYRISNEMTIGLRRFNNMFNETNTNLNSFAEKVTKDMLGLNSRLNSLFGNTWASIIIVGVVTVFLAITVLSIYYGKEREFIYPSELLKEIRSLRERIEELDIGGITYRGGGRRLLFVIIILVVIIGVLLLQILGLFDVIGFLRRLVRW